jgi:hypothetical protein
MSFPIRHGSARAGKKTPEFKIWCGMRNRCQNPNEPAYRYYGGRGIRVHPEWDRDFAAFLRDVGPRPSPAHSLDRIDGDGHYEPGNVRWATPAQQANNKRNNRRLTFDGESLTVGEWARRMGAPVDRIWSRLRQGWSVERILKEPPHAQSARPPPALKVGQQVGRLTLLKREAGAGAVKARWQVRCDCGVAKVVAERRLATGETRSCGCLRRDVARERMQRKWSAG